MITTPSYTELEIAADQQLIDQLVATLSQLGFEGFWEEPCSPGTQLRCYMNSARWSDTLYEEVKDVINTIHRSSSSAMPKISLNHLEPKNWNEEWEKTIQPIHVTKRIVITPTWHTYDPHPSELVLFIDPKMSFGTGYHETTRLVLRLMENHIRPHMTLLDIGTGTGVLAIAGIKLGASLAVGVDNDEWSYHNALENAQLNRVADKVSIMLGEISDVPAKTYDMVVANIQRNVIEPLLPSVKMRLAPGGVVILSGLLNIDEEPIGQAIRHSGFEVLETLREHEWIAFALTVAQGIK